MFVKERFKLAESTIETLKDMEPQFGYSGFGEFIFYRTYSRQKSELHSVSDISATASPHNRVWETIKRNLTRQRRDLPETVVLPTGPFEKWWEVVVRCTEGVGSIRKDWYVKNHISWSEDFWQHYFLHMSIAMFKMEWLPPGRGLWAMGTDFVFERGSMALNNCGASWISDDLAKDLSWSMDALMMGVGVGFWPIRNDDFEIKVPHGRYEHVIEDSREGWTNSVSRLVDAYRNGTPIPRFRYDEIREAGTPIIGFGGECSGPEPLKKLHGEIEEFFDMYGCEEDYDTVLLKTDLTNAIGCCVVAGE